MPEQPCRQHENGPQEREKRLERDTHESKRQRNQPDQRPQQQQPAKPPASTGPAERTKPPRRTKVSLHGAPADKRRIMSPSEHPANPLQEQLTCVRTLYLDPAILATAAGVEYPPAAEDRIVSTAYRVPAFLRASGLRCLGVRGGAGETCVVLELTS